MPLVDRTNGPIQPAPTEAPLPRAQVSKRADKRRPTLIERTSRKSGVALAKTSHVGNDENAAPPGRYVPGAVVANARDFRAYARRAAAQKAPPLPFNARAVIAGHAAYGVADEVACLRLSISEAKQDMLANATAHANNLPPARHWLRALLLKYKAQAEGNAAQVAPLFAALQQWNTQPQAPDATSGLRVQSADLRTGLTAHKFPPAPALLAQIDLPADMHVREMFGHHGYFFVSSTLARGGFGKFRVARSLSGQVCAIKEFRTPDAARYRKDGGKQPRKTHVSTEEMILTEVDGIRKYGEGIQLFGGMEWRGKYYLMMTLFRRSAVGIGEHFTESGRNVAAMSLMRDITDQLTRLHDTHRQVHRDVKLDNFLIDYQGRATLSDFGMVAPLDKTKSHQSRSLAGTHFAPEHIVYDSPVKIYSPASDIFALGAALVEVWLPDLASLFYARQYADGTVDMQRKKGGYLAYEQWHTSLRDETGAVDVSRIENRGLIGRYFYQLAKATPLAGYLLDYLLHPEPSWRLSAAELHRDASNYLAKMPESKLRAMMQKVPGSEEQEATLVALRDYHRAHDLQRLAAAKAAGKELRR